TRLGLSPPPSAAAARQSTASTLGHPAGRALHWRCEAFASSSIPLSPPSAASARQSTTPTLPRRSYRHREALASSSFPGDPPAHLRRSLLPLSELPSYASSHPHPPPSSHPHAHPPPSHCPSGASYLWACVSSPEQHRPRRYSHPLPLHPNPDYTPGLPRGASRSVCPCSSSAYSSPSASPSSQPPSWPPASPSPPSTPSSSARYISSCRAAHGLGQDKSPSWDRRLDQAACGRCRSPARAAILLTRSEGATRSRISKNPPVAAIRRRGPPHRHHHRSIRRCTHSPIREV
ncbi:hypothetical protein C8F01DRAFT_1166824, partial [Mycena amicta]